MGLLSPWFLMGLAGLGVPIFVHLLRRHVTTPRPVSSLMFFERGIQSSTRHRRLKYLLLFALRTALLLLLVFAFANPFIRRSASAANGHMHLIVLDKSFSMRAGTRFPDAKQQAMALLITKPHDDRAQIIALGGQLEILTQAIMDEAQLRSALESIQPGDGRASFGELGRVVRSLTESVHGPIDLHLFSDMQRSAMPGNFADMVLPPNVKLFLHPVAEGPVVPNWTVESVDAPTDLSDPKDPKHSRVHAVIAGFGTPATTKTVSLVVNNKTISTKRVDIPANGRASVDFAPLAVDHRFNRCAIKIDAGDAFPADDISVFTVRWPDPERVLFVHADGDTRSPTYFTAALAAVSKGAFLLQSAPSEQTTDIDPSRFAFVVLSDSIALPSLFEHALSQYVMKGGGVLVTLGTHAGHHAPIPLWGSEVQDEHNYARAGSAATLGPIDFTHPALLQTRLQHANNSSGGWSEVRVFYASVVNPEQSRVAARLSDGTPFLLDKKLGEGHILLLASGLDNLTNDLPLHPVFVSFVDHATEYLSGALRMNGSTLVDSVVELRSETEPVGAVASSEVIDPDGHRPLSLDEARTAQTFRLAHAGFYQIRFANGRDAVIGVNPDRRESDLEPLSKDVQQLWTGSSAGTSQNPDAVVAEDKYRSTSIWWYVMLFALVVALAELTLASGYMGTQREDA